MKERYNMDKAHTTQRTSRLNWQLCRFALLLFTLALVAACARMVTPMGAGTTKHRRVWWVHRLPKKPLA